MGAGLALSVSALSVSALSVSALSVFVWFPQNWGLGGDPGSYSYVCDGTSPGSPVLSDGHTVFTAGLSSTVAGVTAFRHEDALGSLRYLTDAGQNVLGSSVYEAFGVPVGATGSTAGVPFGFVGGADCQTEADTGLVLMGHRYYDSRVGRFISQDPAGDGDNWYAYCDNDPVNELDPAGLFEQLMGTLEVPGGWNSDQISNFLYSNDYEPGTYEVNKGTAGAYPITIYGMTAVTGFAPGGGFGATLMTAKGNVGNTETNEQLNKKILDLKNQRNAGGLTSKDRDDLKKKINAEESKLNTNKKAQGSKHSRESKDTPNPSKMQANPLRRAELEQAMQQAVLIGTLNKALLYAAEGLVIADEAAIVAGVVAK